MTDTIFALSSGAPPAAIAIVRVSGPGAPDAARRLLGRVPPARRGTLVEVRDPYSGERLDRSLALFFPAPQSATGEDVLELHLHGGRAIVRAVENALSAIPGVRRAEPGEFTRRAVVNGRMDLLEAESLGDLLAAETELQRRTIEQGGSAFRRAVEGWRLQLLALCADVETAIDHEVEVDEDALRRRACSLRTELRDTLTVAPLERLRDGFLVVIGGPPNAGKSTLFNAILGDDAAIVSPVAGTTRDAIERVVTIGGLPIRLVDTAGQRASGADAIEEMGIERASALSGRADLLLWMDRSEPPPGIDLIRVQSHGDVTGDEEWADVVVSGRDGSGVSSLLDRIGQTLAKKLPKPRDGVVSARQRALIVSMHDALRRAEEEPDLVLLAAELADARTALDRLTGRSGVEDLLDTVFARFCLGK